MKKIKLGKASGLSELSMEMINASEKVGIDVMMKLCQRVLLRFPFVVCPFVHSEARMPSLARLSKRLRAAGTNGRLDLSLTWRVSEDPLKRLYKI